MYVVRLDVRPRTLSIGGADLPQWDPHSMKGTMMAPTLYCLDIMLLTLGALIGASLFILALLLFYAGSAASAPPTLLHMFLQPQMLQLAGLSGHHPASDRRIQFLGDELCLCPAPQSTWCCGWCLCGCTAAACTPTSRCGRPTRSGRRRARHGTRPVSRVLHVVADNGDSSGCQAEDGWDVAAFLAR